MQPGIFSSPLTNASVTKTTSSHEIEQIKPENASVANSKDLLLAEVLSLMAHWRANKKAHSDAIPEVIWHKLHVLRNHYPAKQLSSLLQIPTANIENKCHLLSQPPPALTSVTELLETKNSPSPLSLCEVRVQPLANSLPADKIYAPQKIEQKKTLVVELQRPDGMIMKIYATTDSIQDIFQTFLKG